MTSLLALFCGRVLIRYLPRPLLLLSLFLSLLLPAHAAPADAWSALRSGTILLLRHSNAPGVGDPAGFNLSDCSTQRNLDDGGRAQARRLGTTLRERGVRIGAVWTSQWCRTRETASLAFPGTRVREMPAFNSFFEQSADAPTQTDAALALLRTWKGPGVLVVSTHQVNITALTGVYPTSGEGVVVRVREGRVQVLGRLFVE